MKGMIIMTKKVQVKLYMNGGFTFQLWDSLEEYKEFKRSIEIWKSPDYNGAAMFTFYSTAETTHWSREDKMVTVDGRQIVAYELICICDVN